MRSEIHAEVFQKDRPAMEVAGWPVEDSAQAAITTIAVTHAALTSPWKERTAKWFSTIDAAVLLLQKMHVENRAAGLQTGPDA
jgi:hypothetical protein